MNNQLFSIYTLELGPMENLVHVILDHATNSAAVIDPGWEPEEILAAVDEQNATITDVLLTHSHFDHVEALTPLINHTPANIHLHKDEAQFWRKNLNHSILHQEGDVINLGQTPIKVLHTPGHTPGSICYLVHDHLFTGDTLFVLGHGRCDLPGGDARVMYRTLFRLAHEIPATTMIHPGHNYGGAAVTMAELLVSNPSLNFPSN